MRLLIQEMTAAPQPERVVERLQGEPGVMLLHSARFDPLQARYSFVAARPFLTFRSFGSCCALSFAGDTRVQFGNPWHLLDALVSQYELLEQIDLPFPLGGCFGYWGYDLKNFAEPKLSRRAVNDLDLPDCHVGFYDSVIVFDHLLGKTWIISTGLKADGSRTEEQARRQMKFWRGIMESALESGGGHGELPSESLHSNLSREEFIERVERAQAYIRAGDIYQVNLSHRLAARFYGAGWDLYQRLSAVSPAPFAAFLNCGDFEIASSSPELFLRMSGRHIQTRPIKGTRPRSPDPIRDSQLAFELQSSPKEMAELVMITDLLRNDLGKMCEFGSVYVPELMRLERYSQVQHLVSTIEGRLRPNATHFETLASCFPGGSVTGAPKFRAMEIIDELEPISRGPYTGVVGYLGFNRESQFSIMIRTAVAKGGVAYFHSGAGIVADSIAQAEYEETLAKARGFLQALEVADQNESFAIRASNS